MQQPTNKIECTDKMRERLKELQDEQILRLKDKDVAANLGITYDTYKNIKTGKIKYIKPELFSRIKHLYDCTGDYLKGTSGNKHQNSDGSPMESPILFSEANQKMTDVANYLYNDYKTLNNLHLLFYRLPALIRENMIATFNSICDNIRITTLVDRKDNLNADKLNYIIENLNTDNSELTKMNLKLAEADRHLSKNRKKQALLLYLEIIYYSTYDSFLATKRAVSKLEALTHEWSNFPEVLRPLSKEFYSFRKAQEKLNFQLPADAEKIIYEYLKDTTSPFKTRDEYIKDMITY